MSEIVKISKETDSAIKELRKAGYTNYQMVFNLCNGVSPHQTFNDIQSEDVDTIIRALYIGYEIEETPEDKVREIFENSGPFHGGIGETGKAYRDGIRDTLDTLNIKIEGINAQHYPPDKEE